MATKWDSLADFLERISGTPKILERVSVQISVADNHMEEDPVPRIELSGLSSLPQSGGAVELDDGKWFDGLSGAPYVKPDDEEKEEIDGNSIPTA